MGESIAIMIVFFIIVAFGLMFYSKIMESCSNMEKLENIELQAVQVAQKASFLPELQCSQENNVELNCIDLLKIDGATNAMKTYSTCLYADTFGLSVVRVVEIFPDAKQRPRDYLAGAGTSS